jgi:thiol-disulfide isomerase/thioredoxin
MDYYNKILILKKYYKEQINNNDLKQANNSLLQIKNLHGKIIEHILMLKESTQDNKLELLSDLERINFKVISIINDCEDSAETKDKQIIDSSKQDKQIEEKQDKEIEEVIQENEESKINKNLPFCVLFYADWCGHCKNLMPTWDSLSKTLPSNKINMIKISCVDKEQQCNGINDIKGYPTIIYVDIQLKKKIIFSGQRTAESIIDFINKSNGSKIV